MKQFIKTIPLVEMMNSFRPQTPMKSSRCLRASVFCSLLFLFLNAQGLAQIPIVPAPQIVEIADEVFSPKSIALNIPTSLKDHQSAHQLREALRDRYILSDKGATVRIGLPDSDSKFRKIAQKKGLYPETRWGEEGYSLLIEKDGITLAAATQVGLFYGVQSLKQLLRGYDKTAAIPCMKIVDWPALPVRGLMDDISRGPLPNMEFMKAQVRRFSELKFNLMTFYIEHVIRTETHPSFSPLEGISIREWKELSDYAAEYHIELMGSFQSLGHFRNILSFPQYADLGLTNRMLKPGDPDAISFLTDVYSEMYPVFSSEVFAINCDEAWDLGRGKNKALADSIGVGGIYASHVNPLIAHVKANNKQPIMWGDIALSHPEVLDQIPKETLIGTWDYSAKESFATYIDPFVEKGFDFWVCPGVLNSYRFMPDFNESLINIRNFVGEGYEKGGKGMLLTVWDDGGRHFFSRDWYGVAFGAEQSWQPNDLPVADFDQRFNRGVYGSTSGNLPNLLHQLNELSPLAPTQELNNQFIWQQLIPELGQEITLDTDGWEEVERIASLADSLFAQIDFGEYPEDKQFWDFTLHQLTLLLETRETLLDAATAYKNACRLQLTKRGEALGIVRDLQQQMKDKSIEWRELQSEMENLWEYENRTYWQEEARAPYTDRWKAFSSMEKRLEASGIQLSYGNYLLPPKEVRLAISETAGKYFSYWLIAGPFTIKKPHITQPDFLTAMGGEEKARPGAGELFQAPDGRTLMWDKYQSPLFDRIDFTQVYEQNKESAAYAYCRITSPVDQVVRASFGSNDGIEVFCNGEKVFRKLEKRSLIPDEDECMLSLKAGTNYILLKIEQWKAGWGFSFRLPDHTVRNHKYKYEIVE